MSETKTVITQDILNDCMNLLASMPKDRHLAMNRATAEKVLSEFGAVIPDDVTVMTIAHMTIYITRALDDDQIIEVPNPRLGFVPMPKFVMPKWNQTND